MYNEVTKKATLKYRANNIKRIALDIPIAEYEQIKKYCDDHGETLSGFIRKIIQENIK